MEHSFYCGLWVDRRVWAEKNYDLNRGKRKNCISCITWDCSCKYPIPCQREEKWLDIRLLSVFIFNDFFSLDLVTEGLVFVYKGFDIILWLGLLMWWLGVMDHVKRGIYNARLWSVTIVFCFMVEDESAQSCHNLH